MRSLKEALIRKNRNIEQTLFDAEYSEKYILRKMIQKLNLIYQISYFNYDFTRCNILDI